MITLGSQSQLGIGIAISLQNHFSAQANQINAQLKALKKNANSAAMSSMNDYRTMAAGVGLVSGGLSMGMYNMAKDGAALQHRINQVAVIGGSKLGKTREELAKMSSTLAVEYARKPEEIADALLENVRAGITSNLRLITEYSAAAAAITGEQLGGEEGVAKTLIGSMNAYGIAQKDFARVANGISAAANISMSSVRSIGEAMEYSAFTAKKFNVPLEDHIALIAKLSQANIEASSGGTALNNMYMQLGSSLGNFKTPKQTDAWAALGLDTAKMAELLNSGQILKIVHAIDRASAALSPTEKVSALKSLLNLRGTRGVLASFGDTSNPQNNIETLRAEIGKLQASDVTRTQAKASTNDLHSDMIRLGAQWNEFKRSFSEAAAPVLRRMLQVFTKLADWAGAIVNTNFGKFLVGVIAVAAPLVAVLAGFRVAALTATMALNQLALINRVGGFGGLMRAGMGSWASTRLGGGPNYGALKQNKLGKYYVGAGQTFSQGGKTWKAGSLVPHSVMGGTGLGMRMGNALASTSLLGGTGMAGKIGSFVGKAGPALGKIAGMGLRILPVVGTALLIADAATGIYNWLKSDNDDEAAKVPQDMQQFYLNQLSNKAFGTEPVNLQGSGYGKDANKKYDQTIQIYIDGAKAMEKKISKGWQDVNDDYMLQFTQ